MSKVVMGLTDTKKVKVYPKTYRYISDILEKMKRIEEPMELTLNKKEIVRAMSNAVVVEIGEDGTETVLNPFTYNLKSDIEDGGEDNEPEEPVDPETPDPEEP